MVWCQSINGPLGRGYGVGSMQTVLGSKVTANVLAVNHLTSAPPAIPFEGEGATLV